MYFNLCIIDILELEAEKKLEYPEESKKESREQYQEDEYKAEPENSFQLRLIVIACVLACLYVISDGPVYYFTIVMNMEEGFALDLIEIFYTPLNLLYEHSLVYEAYINWWIDLADPSILAPPTP